MKFRTYESSVSCLCLQGEIEFKSLLYIPGMAPFNSEDMVSGKTKNIRLYVKRVFISDEFDGELVSCKYLLVAGVSTLFFEICQDPYLY